MEQGDVGEAAVFSPRAAHNRYAIMLAQKTIRHQIKLI